MIPDIDIWRCAQLMVDQHGDQAQIEAIDKATVMVGRGDMAGQRTWLRIFEAIGSMEETGSDQRIVPRDN